MTRLVDDTSYGAPERDGALVVAPVGVINRTAPVPYWAQLAEILRRQINTGVLLPGEPLPTEHELCARFDLSRTVVRQALQALANEGLVVREKGRGTFVSGPKLAGLVVQEMRGFLDEMRSRGHAVETTVVAQDIIDTPPQVAPALGLSMRSRVVHLGRVRMVDGLAVVAADVYLPAQRFAELATMDLREASLYAVLTERFGVVPSGGWRRIEAEGASDDVAVALGVEPGTPVLIVTAVSVAQDGTPFEFFRAAYRGDRTTFEVRIEAGSPSAAHDVTVVG